MNSIKLNGLVAATHTPFNDDGSLALELIAGQAAFLEKEGFKSIFITGSTGESSSLSFEERKLAIQEWSKIAPRHGFTLVVHVGSNCLHEARDLAKFAADCGVDAISALSPSYYKPATVEDLVDCCAFIAAAAPEVPFYYYDIPVLTGVEFSMVDFLKAAESKIPNLAGIKYTNSDLEGYQAALEYAGDRYDLPWGIDEKLIDATKVGATGAVGSTYNFIAPVYLNLLAALEAGDEAEAARLQADAVKCVQALAEVGYLGACKALMGELGAPMGPVRLPLTSQSGTKLEDAMEVVKTIRRQNFQVTA